MRAPRTALAMALVLGAGCGGAPLPVPVATEATSAVSAPVVPAALAARLERVVHELAPRGFRALPSGGQGFLLEGDTAAHLIELPAGTCVTVLAAASVGVRDLDARLYTSEGTLLAEDDEPDPSPIVQTCPAEGGRVYWTAKMFAGAGAYRFVVLTSPEDVLSHAVALVRGEVRQEVSRSRLDQRLTERAEELEARGFSARGEPVALTLGRAETVRIALPVERGGCYTILALGGDGIEGLDLDVTDEDGVSIAVDAMPGAEAITQVCSESEETLSGEVHVAAGAGEVRFAVLGAPSEAMGGAGRLWLGQRRDRPGEVAIGRAVALAEERLRRAGGTLRPTAPPARIQQHEVQTRSVQTRAGTCTAVLAVGGRGIGRIRLSAFDAEGDPAADPTVGVAWAALRICPVRTALARIDVEALRGWGQVALVVADEVPAAATRGARPLVAARLQGLIAAAGEAGFGAPGAAVTGRMPSGALRQHPGSSDARCVRFIAAADGSATELRLHLLDRSGRRLSADRSVGGAGSIELCEAPGLAATVEVRVDHGGPDVEYRLVRVERN